VAVEQMTQVLLVGNDWKFRALLRAQLIEEGMDVEAHETVSDAIQSLATTGILPGLFVADLSTSANPVGDAENLTKWSRDVPVWIIASQGLRNLEGRGFEMILHRPLDVGQLIIAIKRRIGA
jgi:CheY-like chemotaxis protein